MTLPEATRLSYLALLGIEQWLPRGAVPEIEQQPVVPAALPVASATMKTSAAGPSLPSAETAARLDELLARPAARSVRPASAVSGESAAPDATLSMPAPSASAANGGEPGPAAAMAPEAAARPVYVSENAERIGCAMLLLPNGVLLVADYLRPDAPGLASAESAMLMRLAGALVPGQALPMPTEFSWPPAGMRLPGMDKPGAAGEALGAMLAEQRRCGLRMIAVLGEGAARVLVPLSERLGLSPPVVTVSLAAMLLEPDLKRECWSRLAPLKTDLLP